MIRGVPEEHLRHLLNEAGATAAANEDLFLSAASSGLAGQELALAYLDAKVPGTRERLVATWVESTGRAVSLWKVHALEEVPVVDFLGKIIQRVPEPGETVIVPRSDPSRARIAQVSRSESGFSVTVILRRERTLEVEEEESTLGITSAVRLYVDTYESSVVIESDAHTADSHVAMRYLLSRAGVKLPASREEREKLCVPVRFTQSTAPLVQSALALDEFGYRGPDAQGRMGAIEHQMSRDKNGCREKLDFTDVRTKDQHPMDKEWREYAGRVRHPDGFPEYIEVRFSLPLGRGTNRSTIRFMRRVSRVATRSVVAQLLKHSV